MSKTKDSECEEKDCMHGVEKSLGAIFYSLPADLYKPGYIFPKIYINLYTKH